MGDEVMAAALIDRILHHCHIVNIRGNSYRMRQHTELWKALHSVASATPPPHQEASQKTAGGEDVLGFVTHPLGVPFSPAINEPFLAGVGSVPLSVEIRMA